MRDQLGERERASGLMCPWCHGGRTEERSLLAWRQGVNLLAKCKRAKCGRFGGWDSVDLGMVPLVPGKTVLGKRYVVDTMPLAADTQAYLEARYRLQAATLSHFGLRQMYGGRAAYCPVYGPTMASRGWMRRWLDGTTPKVKGYPSWDHPAGGAWQAWFTPHAGRAPLVVCVEDVFSAMRLWERGIAAVALLGVALTDAKVAELRQHTEAILVALDADAFTLAIGYALRFHIQVRRLEVDIKDMNAEQLTTWTKELSSLLPPSAPAMPALPFSPPT